MIAASGKRPAASPASVKTKGEAPARGALAAGSPAMKSSPTSAATPAAAGNKARFMVGPSLFLVIVRASRGGRSGPSRRDDELFLFRKFGHHGLRHAEVCRHQLRRVGGHPLRQADLLVDAA